MLPDRYRQLLTAFVDGELSARQRRHVARLLHRSPEARHLLRQLQEDAQQLRALPCPPLPFDLTGEVMRTIAERRLIPGPRRLQPRSVASTWAAPLATWAAAAAVLIILGVTSYLYFAASVPEPTSPDLAQTEEQPSPDAVASDPARPSAVAKVETPPTPPQAHPQPRPDHPRPKPSTEIVKQPNKAPTPAPETHPAPPREDAALTDRMEMFRLKVIDDLLPVVVKVHELDQEPVRRKLIAELNKDANFRLELPCKNGTKAFERVQAGAKALNLGLLVEKRAHDRLQVPARKTNYVVYIENLPPEDLARFLQHVAAADKKSAARKPAESQLDRLVLTRMTAEHHKELSALLGVDPTVLEPAAKGPLGTDPRKLLSEQTAKQVSASLAGQGSLPRPEPGKPVAKPPENFALVLAYNPVRPSPGSAEIKRFLDNRKPARPGTLRVLLVLRS